MKIDKPSCSQLASAILYVYNDPKIVNTTGTIEALIIFLQKYLLFCIMRPKIGKGLIHRYGYYSIKWKGGQPKMNSRTELSP